MRVLFYLCFRQMCITLTQDIPHWYVTIAMEAIDVAALGVGMYILVSFVVLFLNPLRQLRLGNKARDRGDFKRAIHHYREAKRWRGLEYVRRDAMLAQRMLEDTIDD